MGMNVRLHPCDEHYPLHCYCAETVFELSKWCNVLGDIIKSSRPITLPVCVNWTPGYYELRSVPGQVVPANLGVANGDLDPDCTWLVDAFVIKCLVLHEEHDSEALKIKSRAVYAYFCQLPDDWPVIVHYV
jgi:hypothetical protein